MIETLAQHPAVQPVGWALLHSLWQGCLVALLLAAVLALMPKQAARGRYAAACGALILLVALPVATAVGVVLQEGGTTAMSPPVAAPVPHGALDPGPEGAAADATPATPGSATVLSAWSVAALLPWLFTFWLAGVVVLGAYHLVGWQRLQRLRHQGSRPAPPDWQVTALRLARRLGVTRSVALVESTALEVPAVIGWLRPVLLVPASAFAGMPPQQLEAILAHELAHVRRWDYLVNLLQTAAETLLFFHPAVWWVSHQARIEREHCCDDLAVAVCGDRTLYAHALAGLETLRSTTGLATRLAPHGAMAADGGSLLGRIRRLAGLPPHRPSRLRPRAWATAALTVVAVLATAQLSLTATEAGAAAGTEDFPAMTEVDLGPVAQSGDWSYIHQGQGPWVRITNRTETGAAYSSMHRLNPGEAPGPGELWQLSHDAGRFDFTVTDRDEDSVEGTYTFRPNRAFQREMDRLGYTVAEPDAHRLALAGLRLSFVQGLAEVGYQDLEVKLLVKMRTHRVTPEFVKELAALGYRDIPVELLIALRVHKVTPDFIRQKQAEGVEDLTVKRLLDLRIHGSQAALPTPTTPAFDPSSTLWQALGLADPAKDPTC